jgi:hypothetical protein
MQRAWPPVFGLGSDIIYVKRKIHAAVDLLRNDARQRG